MNKRLYFFLAVWGQKYRSYLLDYCLPSLLLNESDIPAGSVLLLCCPRDDWEVIVRDKTTERLSHVLTIRWIEFSPSGDNHNANSGRAFAEMTTIAYAAKAVGVILMPDYLLACDMVKFINNSLASGVEALVFPGLRISHERLDLELPTHRTLTMHEMVPMMCRTLHPESLAYEWTSKSDVVNTGHIWKRTRNGGMTIYCLTWSTLMMDYAALPEHDPSSLQYEMTDGSYTKNNVAKVNTVPILYSVPLLAFQDDRDAGQYKISDSWFAGPMFHSWAILRTLQSPHISDLHRRLFLTPVTFLGVTEEFIDPQAYLDLRFPSNPWLDDKLMHVYEWWKATGEPKTILYWRLTKRIATRLALAAIGDRDSLARVAAKWREFRTPWYLKVDTIAACVERFARTGYKPAKVAVQVSRRCNITCKMCGWKAWQRNKGFMSRDIFVKTLDDMDAMGVKYVNMSSAQGEPLLNPQIGEFIELAQTRDFFVEVNTNCTPLGPRNIEMLVNAAKYGNIRIQCSFSGYNAQSHESVYVGSKFAETSRKLQELNRRLTEVGAAEYFFIHGIMYDPENEQKHRDYLATLGITERIFLGIPDNFAGIAHKGSVRPNFDKMSLNLCPVLTTQPVVYDDGEVSACSCRDSENIMNIGNIKNESLDAMRRGPRYRAMLKAFARHDLSQLPLCRNCDIPYNLAK